MLRTHFNCVARSLISDLSELYQIALSTFAFTFGVYFIYSTFISLLLLGFNFRESRNSCFSKNIYYAFGDFIIVIRKSFYYRYFALDLLSLFNVYFIIVTRFWFSWESKFVFYKNIFIMRSRISLSLLDVYFSYLTFILLSLFDFDFRKSSNSYFSHIFIMRPIVSLLLFGDHFIYLTFDV